MEENDYILISKFLENELTEDEVAIFKEKYAHDPDFKKEVNIMSKLYISLDAASRIGKKGVSGKLMEEHGIKEVKGEAQKNLHQLYRYAAVIIPLIAFGLVWVLTTKSKPEPEELYAQYFKPESEGLSKGGDEKQDFAAVIRTIDRFTETQIDSLGMQKLFIFGIYCMEHQRYNEAIFAFHHLIESNIKGETREDCDWFLGLCYLQTGNKKKAEEYFSTISSIDGHIHQQDAKEILSKLH